MASLSSQRKNASRVDHDHAAILLEDGLHVEAPDDSLITSAEALREIGVIQFRVVECVRCVDPRDADFPPRNRNCEGRIILDKDLDEEGDEIRCPECQRPVRPYALNKVRHKLLQSTVAQDGVIEWLKATCDAVSDGAKPLGHGVFRVDGFGDFGVTVCVVDVDGPEVKFNAREWASQPHCSTQTIKLATDQNGPRREARLSDFTLRKHHVALVTVLRSTRDGARVVLEVKAGLPFVVRVESQVA